MKIGRTNHLLVEVLANRKLLICFHKKNLFTWLCLPTVPEDWSQGRLQNLPSPSTKPSAPPGPGAPHSRASAPWPFMGFSPWLRIWARVTWSPEVKGGALLRALLVIPVISLNIVFHEYLPCPHTVSLLMARAHSGHLAVSKSTYASSVPDTVESCILKWVVKFTLWLVTNSWAVVTTTSEDAC